MNADNDFGIDVIIPVYNGEKYIADALRSAAGQTYPPTQIIVVDDGCQDRTPEIVRDFPDRGVPINYVRQPRNLGLSAARNLGIREASSPYVAFLDADDLWLETKLAAQIELFRQPRFPNLGIVSCSHYAVDSQDRLLRNEVLPIKPRPRGQFLDRLLQGNLVSNGSAALVKRECFDAAGLFDESLPTCEDWDMWLRILCHYQFDHREEPHVRVRFHPTNMSKNRPRMFLGNIMVFNKWTSHARRRSAVLRGWRPFATRMLLACLKELPDTSLFHTLRKQMSPELKQIFLRLALPAAVEVGKRGWQKLLRDAGLVAAEQVPNLPTPEEPEFQQPKTAA